jgi:hypothetical protein
MLVNSTVPLSPARKYSGNVRVIPKFYQSFGFEWALEKVSRVQERLTRAKELYDSVFTGFQRKVLDSYKIRNVLKLYFMVKMSRELETAEAFLYLTEAVRVYNENFPTTARMLDEDPVGNIITLAQYMMEAKEPTRRAIPTQEIIARIVQKNSQ